MPAKSRTTVPVPVPSNAVKADRNAEIRSKYDPGNNVGVRTLAQEYGISETRVKQILRKQPKENQ